MDWPGAEPPNFIWATAKKAPRGTFYNVDELATQVAAQMLINVMTMTPPDEEGE